jgi:hypothetical protein
MTHLHKRVIQRMEVKEASELIFHQIEPHTRLYHSTNMKLDAIKQLTSDASSFTTPAYFKEVPTTQYGAKTIVFEAKTTIDVLDMGKLQTVSALYEQLMQEGSAQVAEALRSKCVGKVKEGVITSVGKWQTATSEDSLLATWLKDNRFEGWLIPFEQPEIMLTSTAGLQCLGKHKW